MGTEDMNANIPTFRLTSRRPSRVVIFVIYLSWRSS